MSTRSAIERPFVSAFALFAAAVSQQIIAPTVAHSQALAPTRAEPATAEVAEAALITALERSEAGEIEALGKARMAASDPVARAVIDARLAASRLDIRAVNAALARAERSRLQPKWRAILLATRAGTAFATGDYALATKDSAAWLALAVGTDPIHRRDDIEQLHGIAERLAYLPRQSIDRAFPGSVSTSTDKAALIRATVSIHGKRQEAVLDTGANLSVVTESTAKALGLEVFSGGNVKSSSRAAVPVRLAIARHFEIAGTSLRNVVFLVLNDADLRFPLPGGYDIPAIVGFPVLRALGRATFTRTALVTGLAVRSTKGADLVASGSNLFVRARVNAIAVPLHLDSGASTTALGPRFSKEHPALVSGLGKRATRSAGAGGAVSGTASVLNDVEVEIGDVRTHLPAIDVAGAAGTEPGNYGTLGQDVLRSTGSYTLDFKRLTLTLEQPKPDTTDHR